MNNREITPLEYLRTAMGNPEANFRDGQDIAIAHLLQGERLLVIQATGWGKSMVYFVSTKIRRLRGYGPTLLISPLLALMRNQLESAQRLGLTAATINSDNKDHWADIFDKIKNNCLDVLLVSPERLANSQFQQEAMELLQKQIGMLVIDEAHCISDWGHEFRPDYRRFRELLPLLPANLPILATTATANKRVINDIEEQLGNKLFTLRGTLLRKSLMLQNITIPQRNQRLAWLAQLIPQLPGSGLVYALTTNECEMIAAWLKNQHIEARAYHAKISLEKDGYTKEELEELLQKNKIKCLVCTIALGMGFDKPDLGFVVHYQRPSSVVHYYQQVGRAGRGCDNAFGILASGLEDNEIANFFIENSLPEPDDLYDILNVFEETESALCSSEIADLLERPLEKIEAELKFLAVAKEAPIEKKENKWRMTAKFSNFRLDRKYMKAITETRLAEEAEMNNYMREKGCLMSFMQKALGEENPQPCGRCYNCRPENFPIIQIDGDLLAQAAIFRHRHANRQIIQRQQRKRE